ncbi:chemotaxis protein CheW [Stenotrophomonas sp.]|uniref:chemotaxis protein CheW n=1 Tax=Stenotrophomonas sp. TaxID=69392 RepID=UPI00289BEA55|nr:chemotaxis protein CheW [Stenotrophomonas sp.]
MSYASNDEIRGVLIQAGHDRVLVPNATVAEMLAAASVSPVPDTPAWLLGQIQWQGWDVPLMSFARHAGLGEEQGVVKNKVVVLKALGGNAKRPYFALVTPNFPQLISVPRDGLLADASEEALPPGVHMRVLLGELSALLPDLDALETALDEALPA